MKKAKILLSAIAVFAVVGGALAFKAKTYGQLFCTKAIAGGPNACVAGYVGKIDPNQVNSFYYTVTNDVSKCAQTQCEETTFLTDREP